MKNISLNRSKHIVEYFVHYEKHKSDYHVDTFLPLLAVQKDNTILLQSSDKIWISFCNTFMCSGPKYSPSSGITQKLKNVWVCALVVGTGIYKRDLIALKMKRDNTAGQELRWEGGVI